MAKDTAVQGSKSKALPGRFRYSTFSKDLDLPPSRSLHEVVAMSPQDMARASRLVTSAYNELLSVAASLEDPGYRRLMTECVAAPRVTFCARARLSSRSSGPSHPSRFSVSSSEPTERSSASTPMNRD